MYYNVYIIYNMYLYLIYIILIYIIYCIYTRIYVYIYIMLVQYGKKLKLYSPQSSSCFRLQGILFAPCFSSQLDFGSAGDALTGGLLRLCAPVGFWAESD